MSNTRVCREGRLGKFTRPKEQWGKRRKRATAQTFGAGIVGLGAQIAQRMAAKSDLGMIRRKAG